MNGITDTSCVESTKVTSSDIICPFCKQEDFDLEGLKMHLEMGWCEVFNETAWGLE